MAVIGFVDRLTESGARGWVHDDSKPLERKLVTAMLDGNPIGSAIAHEFRLDLKTQGIGDGEHAFSVVFDRPISGFDIPNLSLTASTPDGREHKTLILPKELSVSTAEDIVTADERLRRQVRRLLKYSSPYAEASILRNCSPV